MVSDFFNPYGSDVLGSNPHREGPNATRPRSTRVHLEVGMVLEDAVSSWVDVVIHMEKSGGVHLVGLEDRGGWTRSLPLDAGFWFEGRPIITLSPRPTPVGQVENASGLTTARGRALTNSGSIAAPKSVVRVTRAFRIWAEGRHDTEPAQYVWGDGLVRAGVVVQLLEGADKPEEVLEALGPNDRVCTGVPVDHLTPGLGELQIAEAVTRRWREGAPVLDHPYAGIWQAVKPSRLGLEAWSQIERGTDIKYGTLEALGWPHENQVGIAMGWKRILSRVRNYKDLEPVLPGGVEKLIDSTTAPGLSWALGSKLRDKSIIGTRK